MQHLWLYLDFDGVMHPYQNGSLSRMPLLAQWLHERPDIRVVVSSSWRQSHDVPALQKLFPKALRTRVVGVTPLLPRQPYIRQREIEQDHRRRAGPLIVLDDDARLFEPGWPPLHLTEERQGLTPGDMRALRARLNTMAWTPMPDEGVSAGRLRTPVV